MVIKCFYYSQWQITFKKLNGVMVNDWMLNSMFDELKELKHLKETKVLKSVNVEVGNFLWK